MLRTLLVFIFTLTCVLADEGEDLSGAGFLPDSVYEPVPVKPPVVKPSVTTPVTPTVPSISAVQGNSVDLPVIHPAIPLVDENGQHVLDSQQPYSSRMSCGNGNGNGCHDMNKISHAYHFEMGRDESDDKFGARRGLGALTSPGYFGGFNCMGGNNPQWLSKKSNSKEAEFLDYGAVGFIKNCEECHTGGGFAEKDRAGLRYDKQAESSVSVLDSDYFEWNASKTKLEPWDWQKSGVIEPDCLSCHADLSKFKRPVTEWQSLRNQQLIKNGWFAYANSAILTFLNMQPDTEQGQTLASMETPADAKPILTWHEAAFNANGDASIPMLRFPASENCMVCHSTSHERRGFYGFGAEAKVDLQEDGSAKIDAKDDVHKGKSWTEKGITRTLENCIACHGKNYFNKPLDLSADHQMLMGFSDEDVRRDLNYQPKPMSCEHCHGGAAFGSKEKPALPHSGQGTLLEAHRELWRARGDMAGYLENTLNKTVQAHFNTVACQTCHIKDLTYQDKPLAIGYRYRKAEDGKLKMMPYLPASRYFWLDSVNQRVLSRAERLSVTDGVDSEPKSYQDIKNLKTRLDDLLKAKGYANPNAQMIWTESNDYLISHNTRPVAQTIPCTDCHERKRNGSINSVVADNGILGKNKVRVVAQLDDAKAYPKLVKEGVVKLGMPYFHLSTDGKIVENVDEVLYETKLNPFTSLLQSNKVNALSGEFRVAARADMLKELLGGNPVVTAMLTPQWTRKLFVFNNTMTGDLVKNLWMVSNYTNTSKVTLPNFRYDIIASDWAAFAFTNNAKAPTKLPVGEVASPVFYFQTRCLNDESCPVNKEKIYIKLPYNGFATAPSDVALYAVNLVSGNVIDSPKTLVPAEMMTVGFNYVILALTQLPQRAVLVDLKK